MASSIFLIAETQLFIETVERIGRELDCAVYVAHSPAEALLPPGGKIDLIAFEPTQEADKGFALLDILRLRYELPQSKVVIFGGMPEVQNANQIPLPLDTEAFAATLRTLLGIESAPEKPASESGKPQKSPSVGASSQPSKPMVEQLKPLKLTEPLKLTQALKPIQAGGPLLDKGTQIVRATEVVQEIEQVEGAKQGKDTPLAKDNEQAPPLKSAGVVREAKGVHVGKLGGASKTTKPEAKAVIVPTDPFAVPPMEPEAPAAAPTEKSRAKEPLAPKPAPAASKKLTAKPPPTDILPTAFESTPSWLRTALGLPASRDPSREAPSNQAAAPAAAPAPKHNLEPGPKNDPGTSAHSIHPPAKRLTSDSTPGWLKSALGISSPSAVHSKGISSPSAVHSKGTSSPSAVHSKEAPAEKVPTNSPEQARTEVSSKEAQRDELPADFLSSPEPSAEPTPDWITKALGVDASDPSIAEEPPVELPLDVLNQEPSTPVVREEPKKPTPVHEKKVSRAIVPEIPPVQSAPETARPEEPAAAEAKVAAPEKAVSSEQSGASEKAVASEMPVAVPLVDQPAKVEQPRRKSASSLRAEPSKPVAAPSEPGEGVPLHEAPAEAHRVTVQPSSEAPAESPRDSSRRTAVEAELKATRSLLVEERSTRVRIGKELEQLRAEHSKEVEERRAEQELVRAEQVEREAKAAQLLEEHTSKVAELTALHASLQEALDAAMREKNELQTSRDELQATYERELRELRETSERELLELRQTSEQELLELRESSERELQELRETSEREFQELRHNSERELQELRETSERELHELREANQQTVAELQDTQQRTLSELQEQDSRAIAELRSEVEALKESLEAKELALSIELETVEELKTRVAELTRENEESKNYKEKLEAALAAESLRADEIAGRLVEAETLKVRTRKLADIPRSGKLTLMELATLAGQLVELQANVRLELASASATRTLWLTDGSLSASTSDHEHLITLARRDELIGENQERELAALRMARPSEQREALVARGFLSTEVAAALVARWTAQVAEAAFAESATTYRMLDEPLKRNNQAPEFSLPLLPLVRTALRRARPMESAAAEIAHAILVPVSRELELGQANFSPEEIALIESAQAKSTAEELVVASSLLREQAYSCLLAAYYLDYLRIESYRDPPPPADPEIGMQRLQAKYDQVQDADYFAILGVPRTAGPDEVRRAYEVLSNEFHPLRFSTHQDPSVQERAATVWSSITEAAEALGDDRLRVEYAQHLID